MDVDIDTDMDMDAVINVDADVGLEVDIGAQEARLIRRKLCQGQSIYSTDAQVTFQGNSSVKSCKPAWSKIAHAFPSTRGHKLSSSKLFFFRPYLPYI